MKTVLIAVFISVLIPASFLSAQDTSSAADLKALIQSLQDQIKALQTQVVELQSQLEVVKTELRFTRVLQRGATGDEVKQLQEFLKGIPDVYPEGLVTGYFGPLTEAAVKRFQEKQGIEAIGLVGPKTLTKLNEVVSVVPAIPAIPAQPKPEEQIPAIPETPVIPAQPAVPPPIPAQIPVADTTSPTSADGLSVQPATPAVPATPVTPSPAPAPSPSPSPSLSPSPTPAPSPTPTPSDTISPSVPTGLRASVDPDLCTSQITIYWTASTDNVGVVGYKIYRSGPDGAVSFTYNNNSYTSFNSYGDDRKNLSAGAAYSYTVAAFDAAGNISAQSNPVSASTCEGPAMIYPNGGETLAIGNAINLKWRSSIAGHKETFYLVNPSDRSKIFQIKFYVTSSIVGENTTSWGVTTDSLLTIPGGTYSTLGQGQYSIRVCPAEVLDNDAVNAVNCDDSDAPFTIAASTCTESWSCTGWSSCTNNMQTRTCTDANNCGTTNSKPAISQSCTQIIGGDIKANGSDGPITIPYSTSTVISWTSENATECSIFSTVVSTQFWSSTGWTGLSGTQTTENLTTAMRYTLRCTSPTMFSNVESIEVNVSAPSSSNLPNATLNQTAGILNSMGSILDELLKLF